MKAISLWQPWATGMALGLKRVETRSWWTKHRGLLAIHAAQREDKDATARLLGGRRVVAGAVVAIVDLIDCIEMTPMDVRLVDAAEKEWGDWRAGRFAWKTRLIVALEPAVTWPGHQGLWDWEPPPDIEIELAQHGYTA